MDITHQIPPQDVVRAAYVLAEAIPWYPSGTVHVVVVDPGVGTARKAMVAVADGQIVVCPDNGVIGEVLNGLSNGGAIPWIGPSWDSNTKAIRSTVEICFHPLGY